LIVKILLKNFFFDFDLYLVVVVEQDWIWSKMKKRAKTSSKPKLTMKRQTAKGKPFEFYCSSGKLIWGRASSCLALDKVEEPFSQQDAAKGKWVVEEISVQRDEPGPGTIGYLIRWAELDAASILAEVELFFFSPFFFVFAH
jgi:hypothetical protein